MCESTVLTFESLHLRGCYLEAAVLWILFLFSCSFLLTIVLTPIIRRIAIRWRFVDQPDRERKLHQAPIPRIGGIAIVVAYAGSLDAALLIRGHPIPVHHPVPLLFKLVSAAFLVFLTGLLDDLVGLKPWQKLLGESLAACAVYFSGVQLHTLAGHPLPDWLALPLTMIWLIGCTNAFNLIDGLDGLASGIGVLASISTLAVGWMHGDLGLAAATAPLAGALLAFLAFNFNPASIFLGDGGSLWVGFMLACYAIMWSHKSVTVLSLSAPVMALSVPLLDTTLSIIRRFLRGQPIFSADRGHIHHQLLNRGFSPRRTVLLLYLGAGVGACAAVLQSTERPVIRLLSMAAFCAASWLGIRYLQYQEFEIATRLLWRSNFRSTIKSHVSLHRHEQALMASASVEQFWSSLVDIARELGFSQVEFKVANGNYKKELFTPASGHWALHIPASDTEYLRFMCQYGASTAPLIPPLAEMLYRVLVTKTNEFRNRTLEQGAASPSFLSTIKAAGATIGSSGNTR